MDKKLNAIRLEIMTALENDVLWRINEDACVRLSSSLDALVELIECVEDAKEELESDCYDYLRCCSSLMNSIKKYGTNEKAAKLLDDLNRIYETINVEYDKIILADNEKKSDNQSQE